MKSALIHGVLLAVMLVYGYRTWTRDKTVKPDLGSVVLWSKTEGELASIEYKGEKRTVRLERKTDGKESYWWGTDTSVEKKPKPKPPEPKKPADAGSGSGSATGSAGSGSAVATGSGSAKPATGSGSGSAVATGSGSAKPATGSGSGSAVATGSGSAKAGSGSAVAVGSGSGSAKAGSGSAVAVGSGSAGSGSGSAAPTPPAPVEMVETVKKREFPLGDGGEKVIKAYTDARAVGDLGKPSADQLVDYKLATKDQVEVKLGEVKKELDAVKAEEAADKEKEKEEAKDKDPKEKKKAPPKKADKKPDLQKKIKELEEQKKKAELPRTTLTVTFTDGSTREFFVGGSIYGGSDRYVLDQKSGNAYVLSKDMVAALEGGENSLHLTDPRGFDVAKIEQVELDWVGRKMVAKRSQDTGADGKQVKTWHDGATGKPNQPLATFIDNVNNLRPTEYAKDLKVDTMAPVFRVEYKDATGGKLGSLALYKLEKPPVIPDGGDFDPANPPKGEIEYYVVTERTRVPALVRKDPAQKSEEDLPIVFGDKSAPTAPVPPKPGSNPFGNVPTKPPLGGSGARGGSGKDPHKH